MTQQTINHRKSMHWMRLTAAAALSLSLVACSTTPTRQDQTAIGVGTGAVIGGALGNVIGKNTDGTVIGAAIGGLIGGIVGHNYEDKKAEIRIEMFGHLLKNEKFTKDQKAGLKNFSKEKKKNFKRK